MAITTRKFLDILRRSKLIDDAPLKKALQLCVEEHGGVLPNDAEKLADFLIAQNIITNWQSKKLFDKKYKGFFLGKYKLLGHIGVGGMSSVYLAEHTLMKRLRAIKVLPRDRVDDSSYLERFYREAQATAALDHPNIVRAFDIDSASETHYLVMEYVAGKDLMTIVKDDGPTGFIETAQYILQAARGLDHAHTVGMIHRDVKPANLLVEENGQLKILDMGLALMNDDDSELAGLTDKHNEKILGTADYLAPEQALNSHDIDLRADIYGLGCTMYYALTGHPPFPDGTLAQRIALHQSKMPSAISVDRPDCPNPLAAICFKMLQKEVDNRYQNCLEISVALETWLQTQGIDATKNVADPIHLPPRQDANQSTDTIVEAMYAAVAVANHDSVGGSTSSVQLISGSGSALSDSQFMSVPGSSISTGSSRIELGAEGAHQSLQSTTHGLLDGTMTSTVIKRMPLWGLIVIVISIVCVLVGTLAVVFWNAMEPSTNPITQKQTDSIVISEAFPLAAKAYNDDSWM
jgi:eukaryotic-like serine/threonine-protein kinase